MPRRSSGGRYVARPAPHAAPVRNPTQPAPTQSGGGSILGGIGSTIAQGQPSPVSLVNSVVKESNVVGSSKADNGKESKESSGFDPKFQVTTISQAFSVSSPHFEPSNKQHGLPVKAGGPVKGYCYATPFSSYAHQLYPQSRSSNTMLAARRWQDNDNFKTRSKINQSGESNWINERTRGRGLLVSRTSTEKDTVNSMIKRDQYNLPDFETAYNDALFFVIKSFSEDDIHKCIKYKVWASTQAGNKKLDAAYHYAQERSNETGSKCPVFLFFSVNGSGQFVGLAEMTGPVDFKKTMDFWQQDKWTGFFPVKWHIIKDIFNSHLRHIILENNDNKPVTNSRDTQEVKLKQGCEMLSILKSFTAKSSLLDDFLFFEEMSFHNEKETRRLEPVTEGEVNIDGFDSNMSLNVGKLSHSPKQSLLDLAKSLSLNSQSADKDKTAKDLLAPA